jgi:Fic family protein
MISDRMNKLLQRIDEGKKVIDIYRPIPPAVLTRLRKQLIIEWTYNSNAIEGNTLSLKETQLVLEEGLTIGKKSLKEHLEAINHKDAIQFVEKLASSSQKITERNLREIHSLILKEIDQKYAGKYRDILVRITGSAHTPPEPIKISGLMQSFAKKQLAKNTGHPVIQAALAHFELVSIHPFVDGNGRTARLLMNLILIKNGYLPAVILKNDRKKYYDALERANAGKTDDFIFLVGRAMERTMNLYFEALPDVASKFLTMAEASKICTYSPDYLNILARRGSIPAFKLKRNWLVSKDALQKYIKSQNKKTNRKK